MFCDHSDHHPVIMFPPFNKGVSSIKTTISETDKKNCFLPPHCEQDACVDLDYGCRISVSYISETIFCAELMTNETKARTTWVVAQSIDQNGNIIYQWYDEDGHLHTISEWEYRRRLTMYFQSWLEFLYPEFFGPALPAGGGWHQWQYWKVRRTADRPENTRPTTTASPVETTLNTTGKQQGLLRLFNPYNKPGPQGIRPVTKTVGLSHHHQPGPPEEPLKMNWIPC